MLTKVRSSIVIVLIALLFASVLVHSFGVPFRKARANNSNFLISGINGGSDSIADAYLTSGIDPSVIFSTYSGSTYDVVIKDDAGVVTLCSALAQAGSPVSPTSCGLSNGVSYKVSVTAKPSNTPAFNNEFSFTIDNTAPTTNTITGITGASDAAVDDWLTSGLIPTLNWNAFTNAASYDVTIKDSSGTSVICATQNTASTSLSFSGCTLTHGTSYRAYVTAKSAPGMQATNASNDGFNFTVDNMVPGAFNITGITGGTDVSTDGYLTDGVDPTVVYGTSANAYRYDIVIKDSTGTSTQCSISDEIMSPSSVTCGLSEGQTYKAYITARSISGFLITPATNDGFSFIVTSTPPSSPGNFRITGVTGGSDTTADNWLTSGTTATVNWSTSYGAQNYSVTIRNSTDTATICTTQNTASTAYTFSGCSLTLGTMYLAKLTSNNSPAGPTPPLNDSFLFTVVTSAPGAFKITGAAGGTDFIPDDLLMNGLYVTAHWTASSGATSYDVTIRNSTDTADVCATQNTALTYYTFSVCPLSANTSYLIKVVAKNAATNTTAYNSPFTFLVPNTLTFCPTGSSTSKALIIYDSGGPSGNYSGNEDCNFTISPPATASNITLRFANFDSNDNGDVFTAYDGTSTSGTLLGTWKNTSVAPSDLNATSGNMYLTWKTGSANHATGYSLSYYATYVSAGGFSITGVQGGSDTTPDSLLTDNTAGVTVVWGASANAVNYNIVIRNDTNTYNICEATSSSTIYNLASCNLMLGATYVVLVYANDKNGGSTAATNNPFSFTFENRPTTFTISGATGGTDVTADTYLEDGTTATISWTASTGQTSYDVTIFASDGFTPFCSTVNVGSGSTNYTFSGCTLVSGQYYKAEVIAKNSNGLILASNSPLGFKVGSAWIPTTTTGAPASRSYHSAVWTGSEMIIWGGLFSLGGKYDPTTDSWTSMIDSPHAPSGRSKHAAIWTGAEMIIWGGARLNDGGAYLNNGGRYHPPTNSWTPSTLSLVADRSRHSSVWTGSEMIVWGGEAGTGTGYLDTGAKYNPSTDSWTTTSTGANTPSPRRQHTAVWTGSEMIIWGGNSGSNLNTGGKYNPTTNSWTPTSTGTNVPSARNTHSAIWTGTEMIIWGGPSNTGGKYNPSSDSWTSTSTGTNVPSARTDHSAIWTGSKMIVWGGGAYLNNGGVYDPSANSWTTTSTGSNVPSGRSQHTAIWSGTEMIIWGGRNGTDRLNTGGKYDPSTDTWSAVSTGTDVPSIRGEHLAVWTGSQMIIWGGYSGSAALKTGSKYDPSTDAWSAVSTGTNSPSIRYRHTTVWTGSEMIVFGGYSGGGYLNDGGRYDPSGNTWTAMSSGAAAVPTIRNSHAYIWTGTEMIVWGGYDGSELNTGGKYNPTTDSWTPTSTGTNVPSARYELSAVWTGTEMIVWGGTSPRTNTGGKYNPSTDSWTATSTGSGVPVARERHKAVWTGTEMIIWGGQGSTSLNSGGKYNPTTNTWLSTSTGTNVPSARQYFTAVWTGTEMIVWGGYAGSEFNTGGKYNPSTDSWTATSLTNVPAGRYFHSAVWTGLDMIVWGGLAPTSTNTGGIYAP